MLDAIAKLAPALASLFGVAVALLVYRINADKLFLEMLTARRDAVREVLDAAQARDLEIIGLPMHIDRPSSYNLPGQARFWTASNEAEGLFGPEVHRALEGLDQALKEKIAALMDLRFPREDGNGEGEAFKRHAEAVGGLLTARDTFARSVVRYTHLGRRGLSSSDRWLLWRRDRARASSLAERRFNA